MHQKNVSFFTIGFLKIFKFEEYVCNRCLDLLTMAYSLKNIAILSAKGATFRCILWDISRNEGLIRLNSSVLEDESVV